MDSERKVAVRNEPDGMGADLWPSALRHDGSVLDLLHAVKGHPLRRRNAPTWLSFDKWTAPWGKMAKYILSGKLWNSKSAAILVGAHTRDENFGDRF